jgi:polysaccharide export outer membrane protein
MRTLSRLGLLALVFLAPGRLGSAEEYEVGPGDTLKVIVLDQPTLSGDLKVDAEGLLNFPFLGKVKAGGMGTAEIERKLVTLLSDGYLKRPRVSVTIKEYGSQSVFLVGEFQKPGPYALGADRSLLGLLNAVGALAPTVGHEVIVVRPPPPGTIAADPLAEPAPPPTRQGPPLPGEVPGAEVFRINLRELRSGIPERNVLLQAKDTVYAPKAAQVYVFGHVARPGPYRFEEGLTVYQALLQAGGVTDRGSSKGIKIVRLTDGKPVEIKPKLTDTLEPEDTLKIPERFF